MLIKFPSQSQTGANLRELVLPVMILLAVNLGFITASHLTGATRPWMNVDYALAIVFFSAGFPVIGWLLGLFFLLADSLVLLGQLFPFPRFTDLVYLLSFTSLASTKHLLLIGAAGATLAAKLVAIAIAGRRITPLNALIIFNALIIGFFVITSSRDDKSDVTTYRSPNAPLIASQTSVFMSMRSSAFLDQFSDDGAPFSPGSGGATGVWLKELDSTTQQRLLLIVAESWGMTTDPAVNDALLEPLRSLFPETFERGQLRFDGFTISGELRELCNLVPLHFDLRKVQTGFEDCLPNRLQAAGYATGAMHGATSLMYDRRHWYPRAGFQETVFFEDRIWPRRCYSFPGACDLDMLPVLEEFFSRPGKRFMYWLTLNTHAPYDLRDLRNSTVDCSAFNIPEDTESCRLIRLQSDFFNGLADKLAHESLKGVEVIIVGDHAPNMLNLKERDKDFRSSSVPWVRFKVPIR